MSEREECTLDVVSFGGASSGNASTWDFPFDQRLGGYAKQETFTTTVVREAGRWELPPVNMGLVLDVGFVEGSVEDLNDSGAGESFIVVSEDTGVDDRDLIIESFYAMCDGDYCEVEFSAYERL